MPGFLGFLSSRGGGFSRGGFRLPGSTVGGFFGGFFWSSFCAETANARPATTKSMNRNLLTIFISLHFLSLTSNASGEEGKCVTRLLSKQGATDRGLTFTPSN